MSGMGDTKVASLVGLVIDGSWRLVNSQGQVLLKSHSAMFSSPDLTLLKKVLDLSHGGSGVCVC